MNQSLTPQKFVRDILYVAVLAIESVIQFLHFLIGNLVRQIIQSLSNSGMPLQRLLPHHRDRFVRGKIIAVVFQNEKIEDGNQSIGGIAPGKIDLMILQGRGKQAQIHDPRRRSKAQAIGGSHAGHWRNRCDRKWCRQCNRCARSDGSAYSETGVGRAGREEGLMQAFEYASPTTLQEALHLLGTKWGEADVLAGGTDQISLMKDYVHAPKRVVNIKGIRELHGIRRSAQGLRIGATTTFDELAADRSIHAEFPALTVAVLGVASPQIRNMGTVGGDLCQRPRCWYFRQGYGLLALKDGKTLVPNGRNEFHAIFGGGPAYFVSPSSLGPALVALGAKVKLASASGTRTVDAAKFFVSPQNPDTREIALMPNEILTEIEIPSAHGAKNATYEVRQKEAMDWPLATASVVLTMNGGSVSKAAIVLGHVAPIPWPATQAAEGLQGKSLGEDTIAQAADAAVQGAQPLSENAYKVKLAKVAVKRALNEAAGRA